VNYAVGQTIGGGITAPNIARVMSYNTTANSFYTPPVRYFYGGKTGYVGFKTAGGNLGWIHIDQITGHSVHISAGPMRTAVARSKPVLTEQGVPYPNLPVSPCWPAARREFMRCGGDLNRTATVKASLTGYFCCLLTDVHSIGILRGFL